SPTTRTHNTRPYPSRWYSTPPSPRPTGYATSSTTPNQKRNHPPTPHPSRHHNLRTNPTPNPPHHRAEPDYRPYLRACHKALDGDPPGAEQTSATAAATDCSKPTLLHPADGSSGCLLVGSDPSHRFDGRCRPPAPSSVPLLSHSSGNTPVVLVVKAVEVLLLVGPLLLTHPALPHQQRGQQQQRHRHERTQRKQHQSPRHTRHLRKAFHQLRPHQRHSGQPRQNRSRRKRQHRGQPHRHRNQRQEQAHTRQPGQRQRTRPTQYTGTGHIQVLQVGKGPTRHHNQHRAQDQAGQESDEMSHG